MKKILILTLTIVLLLSILTVDAQTQTNIKVTIPKYNVTINGVLIDNEHSKYPLLNYKSITYFPMTWDYCQALGLDSAWDQENGLRINKSNSNTEIKQDLTSNNNLNISYNAQLSSDKIIVNDKIINNNEEEYPILNFRGITYFPLTWRFSVDEFGWKSDWDESTGLSISSSQDSKGTSNNNYIEQNYKGAYGVLHESIGTYIEAGEKLVEGYDISDIISELQTTNTETHELFRGVIPTKKYEEAYIHMDYAFINYDLTLSSTQILILQYQLGNNDGVKEYSKKAGDYLLDAINSLKKSVELFKEAQENTLAFFTLGSTQEEVLKVMGKSNTDWSIGTPSSGNQWNYGKQSAIWFDETGCVEAWRDQSLMLKVSIGTQKPNPLPLSLGMTKSEVVDSMGTPLCYFEDIWSYLNQEIHFNDDGKVKEIIEKDLLIEW